jgi:hypothetical protein
MRHDSHMNPGRLHVVPKREYAPFDDHTSTMFAKKQAMNAGIKLPREVRYVPQHRRTSRGIVAGVVIGLALWAVIGLFAAWAWRMYG